MIGVEKVVALENTVPLPEVVILGGRPLYHVLYAATEVPDGAVRHLDPGFIARAGRSPTGSTATSGTR
ncbi:hypothetical protein [Streptosporangium sp. NPDC023615]|uniref:hypothetical protein n=1 Tax=Streptosporangium sp. NPDC023615 TaxID=3154794 RepID=UPI00341A41EB